MFIKFYDCNFFEGFAFLSIYRDFDVDDEIALDKLTKSGLKLNAIGFIYYVYYFYVRL